MFVILQQSMDSDKLHVKYRYSTFIIYIRFIGLIFGSHSVNWILSSILIISSSLISLIPTSVFKTVTSTDFKLFCSAVSFATNGQIL